MNGAAQDPSSLRLPLPANPESPPKIQLNTQSTPRLGSFQKILHSGCCLNPGLTLCQLSTCWWLTQSHGVLMWGLGESLPTLLVPLFQAPESTRTLTAPPCSLLLCTRHLTMVEPLPLPPTPSPETSVPAPFYSKPRGLRAAPLTTVTTAWSLHSGHGLNLDREGDGWGCPASSQPSVSSTARVSI